MGSKRFPGSVLEFVHLPSAGRRERGGGEGLARLGEERVTATCGFGEDLGAFGECAQFGEAGITFEGGSRTVRARNGFSEQLDGDVVLAALGIAEENGKCDVRPCLFSDPGVFVRRGPFAVRSEKP
jgi:hypothetical protein